MLSRKKGTKVAADGEARVPRWLLIVLLAAVALGGLFIWSRMRKAPIELQVDRRGGLRQMIPSVVGLTHGTLTAGNQVTVLQNQKYLDAMLEEMAKARESIHFETFVWWEGAMPTRIGEALAAAARRGVQVRVLLDASGAKKINDDLLARMRAAGCKVEMFHPFSLANLGWINNRDHRKITVIDGRVAFVGGHGVADEWTGNAQDKKHWRDSGVRLEGPVVGNLQSAFSENWVEQSGDVPVGDIYFPVQKSVGEAQAHVAYSSPAGTTSSVELLHYLAILSAQREVLIQNPYFIPGDDALHAIDEARKRGVQVSVMIPSDDATDNAIVQHASHYLYDALLRRGVHVYEYTRTLLHQKVMIVDGKWTIIGSTNFDDRSFDLNDEVSVGLVDPAVAAQFRAAFEDDLRHSKRIDAATWSRRSMLHKLQDRGAFLLNGQL